MNIKEEAEQGEEEEGGRGFQDSNGRSVCNNDGLSLKTGNPMCLLPNHTDLKAHAQHMSTDAATPKKSCQRTRLHILF